MAVSAAGQAEAWCSSRFRRSMAVEICTRKTGMSKQHDRHVLAGALQEVQGNQYAGGRYAAKHRSRQGHRVEKVQTTAWARPEQV
jgi:hypothetical protein